MTAELSDLTDLEGSLWSAVSRYNRDQMNALLSPDFCEYGRSGLRYTRAEVLPAADKFCEIDATLHNLAITVLSETIALVTYTSELRRDGNTEWGNDHRSGIEALGNGSFVFIREHPRMNRVI